MPMKLEMKDILDYQQNRDPYLMIDLVEEVEPGIYSKGYKFLKTNEWFFKVHWKDDPNMPGMLQLEALTQMASFIILTLPNNKGKKLYLTNADKIKFARKVLPGEKLFLETKIISFKRGLGLFEGRATVENNLACKAEFKLLLPY
tara:strand:+ start:338 stop:772 length:435 start_codon:yes stop_codon:yes gene_type:complete